MPKMNYLYFHIVALPASENTASDFSERIEAQPAYGLRLYSIHEYFLFDSLNDYFMPISLSVWYTRDTGSPTTL